MAAARKRDIVRAVGIEQHVLDRRTRLLLQSLPIIDGDEDGGFDTAPGDDLGAVFQWAMRRKGEPAQALRTSGKAAATEVSDRAISASRKPNAAMATVFWTGATAA